MTKTHYKKVFNSDYLGACDLEGDLKAIIKLVEVREIDNKQGKIEPRNVAVFTDPAIKPMILNVTNCKIMKKFTKSAYIEDWKNVAVQIYVKDDVKAFGDVTEGLRLREQQPSMEKPELKPGNATWKNAIKFMEGGGGIAKITDKYRLTEENIKLLSNASPKE